MASACTARTNCSIHIIDPSRVVDNEHRTWNLALKNGTFATGIIARENERSLTLRLPGGVEQEVKVADIKSRQDTGLSLMPEGLEALGADALRDILAYLSGGSGQSTARSISARAFTTEHRRRTLQLARGEERHRAAGQIRRRHRARACRFRCPTRAPRRPAATSSS